VIHDDTLPHQRPAGDLQALALQLARELQAAPESALPAQGGGSLHRGLPVELRERFISLRSELFQRGLFDPVLLRFDSASAPLASNREVGAQLERVAAAL
jgi:hypothetical protein